MSQFFIISVGNLRSDLKKKTLKNNLLDLFGNCLQIHLNSDDISLREDENKGSTTALIKLWSNDDVNEALSALGSWENRTRLRYPFGRLVGGQTLTISSVYDHGQHHAHVSGQQRSYSLGELLGNETQEREFKKGGGDYLILLRKDLPKYMCSFLNSEVDGTLYIGVDNDGKVVGTDLGGQQGEDKCRLEIDRAVKSLKPDILPKMYNVEFVPVINTNNKVIEITVYGKDNVLEMLYTAKEGVYIRRHASTEGPVSAVTIQEWSKKKYDRKISHQQQRIEQLENLRSKDLQELSESRDKIRDLQKEFDEKTKVKKKSKICSVM